MARRPPRRRTRQARRARPSGFAPLTPAPPPLFVGRAAELRALRDGLKRLPVALVYGVGGVGKSALAYAAAGRWPRPVVYRRLAEGDRLAAVVDDLRRALSAGAIAAERDEERALLALAAAADARGALVLADDLHFLPAAEAARLVAALGRTLRRGRLVATSRERLPRADGPDRVELQLAPLRRADAAALWHALDRLYGKSSGFRPAFTASAGNPLVLRRWHAGEHGSDDPVADLIEQLRPDERRVAGILAATSLRLPAAALVAALGDGARAAIASLVRKMVVEADAAGLTVHDLLRAALGRAVDAPQRTEQARQAAAIVAMLPLDPVLRGREVVRLYGAAGAWRDAGAYLVGAAAAFIRLGAARDLLAAYDAIPPAERARPVAIARARTLARAGSLREARDELTRLRGGGPCDVELELALAQVAMLTGELALARDAAERALCEPLAPLQSVRAQTTRALILTHLSRGDEARAFLETAEAATAQPKHRAHLALTRAFLLWLDERVTAGESHGLIARARLLYHDADDAYQAGALALPLVSAVLARDGRGDDARAALDEAEPLIAEHATDALLSEEVQFLRAAMQVDLGDRPGALARFAATEQAFAARGNVLGERLAAVWRARVLHLLGRVAEARALLADVAARAASLPSVLGAVVRSQPYDVLVQLARRDDAGTPPALALRRRWLDAIAAAGDGDAAGVRARLRGAGAALRGDGYALDRALVHLARARLAEARGEARRAHAERRRAEAEAADGVDATLVAELAAVVGLGADDTRDPPVLDLGEARLRWPGGAVPLGARPALRRLLVALADGAPVDKTALARALWGAAYKPRTHDNALWVNIMRLRKLVAPAGLSVRTTDAGYRLLAPRGLVVVGGAAGLAAARAS